MKLPTDEMARLDLTEAHEKALDAHEQLERLAKIAADPDAYTVAEYQAAMDAAKYLEAYWGSGPIASEAEEVVAAFVARVEAKRACREHGLVPQAKYDEVCAQLEQAKAARMSLLSAEDVKLVLHPVAYIPNEGEDLEAIRARLNACLAAKLGPASIGIGDPNPPPPPPTKAREAWTGELLYRARWARLGDSATDWAALEQCTRDQYNAIADAVNRQTDIKAKETIPSPSRCAKPAMTEPIT